MKGLMYEAVEFVEVWGRVGGTPAVARPRVLGLFETQVAAAEAARSARAEFRRGGRRDFAWWVVRAEGSPLAEWIADAHSDKEFVLDLLSGELIEVT